MFHDRRVNAKINHIHERGLRIAYQDRTSSFEELLITDNSVSIHQRNLQLLIIQIYRTRMNLNPPPFMKEIFVEREIHYNLRVTSNIYARKPRTAAYGLGKCKLPRAKSVDIPLDIKESPTVKHFKQDIMFWNFICNCRLRKSYIVNIGYI